MPHPNGRKPPNPQRYPRGHGHKPKAMKHPSLNGKKEGCCFAGQAVKAVWLGKFRLARRFARLDVKSRLGLI